MQREADKSFFLPILFVTTFVAKAQHFFSSDSTNFLWHSACKSACVQELLHLQVA